MLHNFPFSRIHDFPRKMNRIIDESEKRFQRKTDAAFAEANEKFEVAFQSR
jgi:hypothetical protein